MTLLYCQICGVRIRPNGTMKRKYEETDDPMLICSMCRNNNAVTDEYRCVAKNKNGNKCRRFRFDNKIEYCKYHWRKKNA